MSQATTNPAIVALQDAWIQAKNAEKQWNDYRLQVEIRILEEMQKAGFDLPEKGTLEIEKIIMTFGLDRVWDQLELSSVITHNPYLLQSMFRVEYKPANNREINTLVAANTNPLAPAIKACFRDKPRKTSFSAKK